MTAERDDEKFALLLDALGPYVDRLVIVGGWAHRLFRHHPLAQTVPYPALMTRDTDVAIPPGIRIDEDSLRERLLARGFTEEFVGDDRPPVTHYVLGGDDAGFYVEFLTPLQGGEFRRDGTRDVTLSVSGISAQKLRHLDVLLIAPWAVTLDTAGVPTTVVIANAVTYIAQKLLISGKRKPSERAKDVLYIHDTLQLFATALPELRLVWRDAVRPLLGSRVEAKVDQAARRLFSEVTDTAREAAGMASGRALSAKSLVEACSLGLTRVLAAE
jgi:hypothetical protein